MSLRVLISVTHLLGAGHLTRAAALARAFAQAGHETTLVSGGSPVTPAPPEGVRFVQLPPVRTIGTDFRTLLDETGQPIDEVRLTARRELLLRTLNAVKPHVLVTELFPFGRRILAGEFIALLDAARAMLPRPLVLSSIRDILVAPTRPDRIAETHERIARYYDAVLVHGDPLLVPLDASWPVDERLRPFLHYTGYVDENPEDIPSGGGTGIVVSGGSSAASLPLYRAALDAAHKIADRTWRVLIGRGVAEADFQTLRALAPSHATVERARPDFRTLLSQAKLSISQAGYNTCVDILRSGVRPILVPFEAGHETEQRLRAERLQAIGLAEIVADEALSGETLAEAVRKSLAKPASTPVRLSFEGARQSVLIAESLMPTAPALHQVSDWSPLDRALSRARDRGVSIGFWWRDDDAVADTPQLDRLLAIANRFEAGIALAAIPTRLEPSLAARLAGEERAFALVHGFRHFNHAPQHEKKAEFGGHRPVETMAEEAADALRRASALLGDKLLPVFVPPWNRIAPDLVPRLPLSGYRALSTFKDRKARHPTAGLFEINTHIDPIDWHGTRSLVDPALLVAGLAAAVERRIEGSADRDEPIGFLTHHLIHDEMVWTFCKKLMVYLSHNDTTFLQVDRLFSDGSGIVVEM
ncbi:glycosyltransferase [Microvirga sp. 2TAF3]|uniref:glycosyltransferase n=1 Tax=Microvirga sp. 2TAF3 TaxID=3233014 RepID=UPI003F9B671A